MSYAIQFESKSGERSGSGLYFSMLTVSLFSSLFLLGAMFRPASGFRWRRYASLGGINFNRVLLNTVFRKSGIDRDEQYGVNYSPLGGLADLCHT